MKLHGSRMKAVVLQSDDWGLCAWSPDAESWRALRETPAYQSAPGRRYGGSTLESADDVRALADLLLSFRGGDGFPPVLQANTVLANPDYDRLAAAGFEGDDVPAVELPALPSRWSRPRLWEQLTIARLSGVWWPELHGYHHAPAATWLEAMRRGDSDALIAFEHQVMVCAAVEASGEFDPAEPEAARTRRLERAVARFRELFGRSPGSFCPPDYRWDERLEADAERLGVTAFQGKNEQHGARQGRVSRLVLGPSGARSAGARFYLPARIAFEPSLGGPSGARVDVDAVVRAVRAAWSRGRPAVVSTHRLNFVHLDDNLVAHGRARLRALLGRLCEEGAVFLVDRELRELLERGWSAREIGERGVLVRRLEGGPESLAIPAPAGAANVRVREGRLESLAFEDGAARVRLAEHEVLLEWERA